MYTRRPEPLSSARPRTLIIADGDYPGEVDSRNRSEALSGNIPNIAEYDVVNLDLVGLDFKEASKLQLDPRLSRKCIHNLLWAGHTLILITDGNDDIQNTILRNLPIAIHLTVEEGSTIKVQQKTVYHMHQIKGDYEEYYDVHVGQWKYYLDKNEDLRLAEGLETLFNNYSSIKERLKCSSYPIASSGFDKSVSFYVEYYISGAPAHESGPIIFLQPPTKTNSTESAIKTLPSSLGFYIKSEAPAWTSEFKIPEEEDKNEEIRNLEERKSKIEEQIERKEQEKDLIIRFKKLLYEQGDELRDIVWETLEELGFLVNKYDERKEDGSIEEDSEVAVLEIKGKDKPVAREDLRQLDDWIKDYLTLHGREPIGILIINHCRLEHPDSRREPFSEDIRGYLERGSSRLCVMTTLQLFDIYCKVKRGELEKRDVREKIMKTKGIFNVEECPSPA